MHVILTCLFKTVEKNIFKGYAKSNPNYIYQPAFQYLYDEFISDLYLFPETTQTYSEIK